MVKKKVLNDYKAEKFLEKYLTTAKRQLVDSFSEIKIKTPLVLKIISDQALHKSDIKGVRIINNESDIKSNFVDLLKIAKNHKIKLDGILVQEFYDGELLIIGIKKDAVFGHVILFGMGGVFTEVYDDISIRKCPITLHDAQEMIDELKAKKIFYGFREKKLNTDLLKKIIVKVSQIPLKHKNIREMDINPFILNEKEGVVADARIVFD